MSEPNIKDLLNEEIAAEIQNLSELKAGSDEKSSAIDDLAKLYKLRMRARLNSLVSHELMTVNEKFKSTYANRFKCFLFMGTNKPVRITDAKG